MEARLKQELPLSDDEYLKKAERFMAQAKKMNDAPIPYMIAAAFMNGDRAAALREEIATLRADASKAAEELLATLEARLEGEQQSHAATMGALREMEAELARERERNQELRQVVKEYREQCMNGMLTDCDTCQRADALLEPQSAPAPTEEPR